MIEAMICQLRSAHPRWGPRRLAYELGKAGVSPVPSRSTIYRVLVRRGLVPARKRKRRRQDYKRWQREAPMQLWQMDITGSVFLTDGTELKLISGIDDHSRFCVIATVVRRATARAVCRAFIAAMRTYGIPDEVLSRQRQAVHRQVRQAPPGRGAVRADLPPQRHPPAAHQAVLADHDREGGTLAPDPAGRVPQRRRAVRTRSRKPRPQSMRGGRSTTTAARTSPWTWPALPISSSPSPRPATGWSCGHPPTWSPSSLPVQHRMPLGRRLSP